MHGVYINAQCMPALSIHNACMRRWSVYAINTAHVHLYEIRPQPSPSAYVCVSWCPMGWRYLVIRFAGEVTHYYLHSSNVQYRGLLRCVWPDCACSPDCTYCHECCYSLAHKLDCELPQVTACLDVVCPTREVSGSIS